MTIAFVADVGGTGLKFALCENCRLVSDVTVLPCADFDGPISALAAASRETGLERMPKSGAVAAAGPVIDGSIELTNLGWTISSDELRSSFSLERLELINDLAAWALALPHLTPTQAPRIAGDDPPTNQAKVVLAAGTGLGMAGIVFSDDRWIPVPGEGGHVTFAPEDDTEMQVSHWLGERYGHVSVERLLSGAGLPNLYLALSEIKSMTATLAPSSLTPETIGTAARTKSCPVAVAVAERFSRIFGSVAGDAALTLGARGGAYIGGGVVRGLGPAFNQAAFRERFIGKGRSGEYLREIPCHAILTEDAALHGLAALVARA